MIDFINLLFLNNIIYYVGMKEDGELTDREEREFEV
jgi:hypothetical protein